MFNIIKSSDKEIADFLGLEIRNYNLKKIYIPERFINAYKMKDNMIYLYPTNDGMPTCPFLFYDNDELIIGNDKAYSQISNLDEIILQMVRIYDKALDNNIFLDPKSFMLELTDEVTKDYHGNAKLVMSDVTINSSIKKEDYNDAMKYYMNEFLDHFIGWNFGLSVNRNETLKKELEQLNEKVIDMGLREDAGPGFEVHGVESKAYNGLQHYRLPVDKNDKNEELKPRGNVKLISIFNSPEEEEFFYNLCSEQQEKELNSEGNGKVYRMVKTTPKDNI